jgi:hypothetical protein
MKSAEQTAMDIWIDCYIPSWIGFVDRKRKEKAIEVSTSFVWTVIHGTDDLKTSNFWKLVLVHLKNIHKRV